MRNILLVIAYKGTNYAGWQIQDNGDTIQGRLTAAIYEVTGEQVILYASGRTDAGVHAFGQTANFYTNAAVPAEKFALALNTKLPADIVVRKSLEVDRDFHARFSARHKTYCYRIYCSSVRNPFLDDYAWQLRLPKDCGHALNLAAMCEAAKFFVGTHDFAGFMSTGSPVHSTVRQITALDIGQKRDDLSGENLYAITVTGNGFLYNMVRIIAGTLAAVGKGEILPDQMAEIIASKDRNCAGMTAPAKGLMLMQVEY